MVKLFQRKSQRWPSIQISRMIASFWVGMVTLLDSVAGYVNILPAGRSLWRSLFIGKLKISPEWAHHTIVELHFKIFSPLQFSSFDFTVLTRSVNGYCMLFGSKLTFVSKNMAMLWLTIQLQNADTNSMETFTENRKISCFSWEIMYLQLIFHNN